MSDASIGRAMKSFQRTVLLSECREALRGMVQRYTDLVNCGDCGSWDPETEDEVIVARKALARLDDFASGASAIE